MKHTPIIHQIRIAIPIILYCNCLTLSTGTTSNLTSRVTYSADMRDANRKGGSNGEGDVLTQDNFTPSSVQRQTAVKNKIGLRYPTRHCPLDSIEDLENLCPQMLQGLNTAYYGQKNRAQDSTPTKPGSPFALKLQANQNGSEALYNTTAGFENSPEVSTWKKYLYGSLSILVISLCSLLGAAFMKVTGAAVKSYMMAAMLSLAVGCLVSDVALELLPETISVETDSGNEEGLLPGNVIKMTAFLGSVYAFFLLELILSKHHSHSHDIDSQSSESNSGSDRSSGDSLPSSVDSAVASTDSTTSINLTMSQDKTEQVEMNNLRQFERQSSNSLQTERQEDTGQKPKTIAWMIILGDGIHNFADGIAIGAAYSVSFSTGLSTSITVLCHEVPHELGDFAVLVSTGLSIKKAMVLNFLSSLTAFVGLYIGLSIGNQEEASKWIFSTAAGMFLYVAMTDLIPECKEYYKKTPTVKMFIFENLGLLSGYGVMLVLTIFEDKMTI